MGMWVVMQLKFCLRSQDENLYYHHYKRLKAKFQQIVALVENQFHIIHNALDCKKYSNKARSETRTINLSDSAAYES